MKTCKTCGKTKESSQFPKCGTKGKGIRAHCKSCYNVKKQATRAATSTYVCHRPRLDEERGILVKECSLCGMEKPIGDFYRRAGRLSSRCKPCEQQIAKARYDADPAKFRTKAKQWAKEHSEKISDQQRKHRLANLEAAKEAERAMYQRRRDKAVAYSRQFYRENHASQLERQASWRARNVEWRRQYARANAVKIAESQRRRAAQKRGTMVERIDYAQILARDGDWCYLCKGRIADGTLSFDHVIPLARGGTHTADNLRVCHRRCNSRKKAKLLAELPWYTP